MRGTVSCYDKALSLVARTEHCVRALRRKLLSRGYDREEVDEVLARLREDDLVNDRRFAKEWIEFRQRRAAEGAGCLVAGLLRRGIDRDLAEEAVNAALTTEDYRRALAAACEKLIRKGYTAGPELNSRLLRKGFSLAEIKAYLREKAEEG